MTRSIHELLDDALQETENKPESKSSRSKFDLPDVSFLRVDKNNMSKHKWWKEIFDQPSFCTPGGASRTSSINTCSHCERRHSTDQQVILFQVRPFTLAIYSIYVDMFSYFCFFLSQLSFVFEKHQFVCGKTLHRTLSQLSIKFYYIVDGYSNYLRFI